MSPASKAVFLACCCLGCLLALARPAAAGRLALEVAARAALGVEGLLEVRATVTNRGDEPALNLQASALHPPGRASSGPVEVLPPGRSAELALSYGVAPRPPGRYAVVLLLDLQDHNQYPLSALGHAYYAVGPDQESPLALEAQPLELRGQGRLALRLANPGPAPLKVALGVFAPRELRVDQAPPEIDLPAGGGRDLVLAITNLSGQPQAQYPLLIWTACDLGGRHSELVSEAKVSLAPEGNVFRERLAWWLALLALLAAWVAWRQARARRGR